MYIERMTAKNLENLSEHIQVGTMFKNQCASFLRSFELVFKNE